MLREIPKTYLLEGQHMFIPNSELEWQDKPTECQWFVGCHDEVAGLQKHIALGMVPVCERHHDFAEGK